MRFLAEMVLYCLSFYVIDVLKRNLDDGLSSERLLLFTKFIGRNLQYKIDNISQKYQSKQYGEK